MFRLAWCLCCCFFFCLSRIVLWLIFICLSRLMLRLVWCLCCCFFFCLSRIMLRILGFLILRIILICLCRFVLIWSFWLIICRLILGLILNFFRIRSLVWSPRWLLYLFIVIFFWNFLSGRMILSRVWVSWVFLLWFFYRKFSFYII